MSPAELDVWIQYRNKYGPMNPVRMYDRGAAIIATLVSRSAGGKANVDDFLPFGEKHTDYIEPDPEEFLRALGPGVKIGQRG
jgi:hypothetical protein